MAKFKFIAIFQKCKQIEILECLQFGRSSRKYSVDVRLFCLTMHFYSPRAYEYLRSVFNLNLPAKRTLQYWYTSVNGAPGFTEEAFNALKQRAELSKSEGKPLLVAMIHDEVFTRKNSQWEAGKQEFLGHITAGKPSEYGSSTPLSKEALVLMVSGIGGEFKLPIGYFLSNGLCAQEKAAIIKEALSRLNQIGIIVVSMTFDGHASNIALAKILGANFNKNRPYFQNPFNKKYKVYIILDPPHMLKLARNCLGNKLTIYNNENNEILWQFIVDLVSLQNVKGLNFGNKLTKSHVEYNANKMNVRLAAETLSNSTANTIEFLDGVMKLKTFENSKGTTKYCRVFNNLFDIMNCKRNNTDNAFKRPICEETIEEFTVYFDMCRTYIKQLELLESGKRKSVLKTKSFTPFFGFFYNTFSFIGIYKEHILPNEYSEFYSFDVSQDHLETFFGCIRSMGGNVFTLYNLFVNIKRSYI